MIHPVTIEFENAVKLDKHFPRRRFLYVFPESGNIGVESLIERRVQEECVTHGLAVGDLWRTTEHDYLRFKVGEPGRLPVDAIASRELGPRLTLNAAWSLFWRFEVLEGEGIYASNFPKSLAWFRRQSEVDSVFGPFLF